MNLTKAHRDALFDQHLRKEAAVRDQTVGIRGAALLHLRNTKTGESRSFYSSNLVTERGADHMLGGMLSDQLGSAVHSVAVIEPEEIEPWNYLILSNSVLGVLLEESNPAVNTRAGTNVRSVPMEFRDAESSIDPTSGDVELIFIRYENDEFLDGSGNGPAAFTITSLGLAARGDAGTNGAFFHVAQLAGRDTYPALAAAIEVPLNPPGSRWGSRVRLGTAAEVLGDAHPLEDIACGTELTSSVDFEVSSEEIIGYNAGSGELMYDCLIGPSTYWVSNGTDIEHWVRRMWGVSRMIWEIQVVAPFDGGILFPAQVPDQFRFEAETAPGVFQNLSVHAADAPATIYPGLVTNQAAAIIAGGADGRTYVLDVPVNAIGIRVSNIRNDGTGPDTTVSIGSLRVWVEDTTPFTVVAGTNDTLVVSGNGEPMKTATVAGGAYTAAALAAALEVQLLLVGAQVEAFSEAGNVGVRTRLLGAGASLEIDSDPPSTINSLVGFAAGGITVLGADISVAKLPEEVLTIIYRYNFIH